MILWLPTKLLSSKSLLTKLISAALINASVTIGSDGESTFKAHSGSKFVNPQSSLRIIVSSP